MTRPSDLFGPNSDGSLRMEHWLSQVCPGCVHEDPVQVESTGMQGAGCALPADAYMDEDVADWVPDGRWTAGVACRRREFPPAPQRDHPGQQSLDVSA